MRTPMSFLFPLIATTFLAGCVVEPADSGALSQSTEPPQRSTDSPRPRPSAEPEHVATEPRGPRPAREGADPGPTTIPITLMGRTPTRACLPIQGCRELEPGHDTSMRLDTLGVTGVLNGTLTWNASTSATQRLYAVLVMGDDQHYLYRREGTWVASGESPLQVSFDLSRAGAQRWTLVIHNNYCLAHDLPVAWCALDGSVSYSLGQDFTFAGEIKPRGP